MFESAKERLSRLQSDVLKRPIQTDIEFEAAGRILAETKTFRKEWDVATKDVRQATKAAHAAACKLYTDIDGPLKVVEAAIIPMLDLYQRREEIARKKREAEMTKQAKAEAKAAGVPVPPGFSMTAPKLTAPDGLTRRVTWSAQVVDKMALVKAVAAGKVPLAYLDVNQRVLDMQASALKSEMAIPGVKAVEQASYSASARR
jgi:hypothetical protein